jgi:hypothetical protein
MIAQGPCPEPLLNHHGHDDVPRANCICMSETLYDLKVIACFLLQSMVLGFENDGRTWLQACQVGNRAKKGFHDVKLQARVSFLRNIKSC